jgi:hypothetical protein
MDGSCKYKNPLNKQSWRMDRGWSSSCGVGWGPWRTRPSDLFLFRINYEIMDLIDSLEWGISPVAKSLPTHNTDTGETHTDVHALSGIRTHDPSIWKGKDISFLRPRGHCDRHSPILQPLDCCDPTMEDQVGVEMRNSYNLPETAKRRGNLET